jgi:hypothetical protein
VKLREFVLAAALSLAAASAAQAGGTPGVDFTAPGDGPIDNCCWTLGYEFQANQSTDVVALATWNSWSSTAPAEVGLWDASGNLLASASVSSTSPTTGTAGWSYTDITPVALTPGATYTVGSFGTSANYTYDPSGFTVDPRITYVDNAFSSTDAFARPDQAEAGFTGWLGGNVLLGGVPEPATWAMLILGVAMIGFAARCRETPIAAAA